MKKATILVVEDDKAVRNLITTTLETQGYLFHTASDGKTAITETASYHPDVIILDLGLPDFDGTDYITKVRTWTQNPIIVVSARSEDSDKIQALDLGADDYLTKPFSASLLRSRINNLLDSRKKLIAQFQQSGTTHASSVHLDEKHSIITEALSKLDNEFIEKITQLVEDNLSSEKIDITYLSDKMCMSGSTLYRKMKALTGLSTNEYIRKVKMQNAERLLLEGKYNISEIAYKVGMNSTGYFRQCFKDEFGVSPSDYLKLIKQE